METEQPNNLTQEELDALQQCMDIPSDEADLGWDLLEKKLTEEREKAASTLNTEQ